MNYKKAGVFLVACLGSAALTVVLLKVLNDQFHIRDRLGIQSVATAPTK